MAIVRRKDKQAQMMVADLSALVTVDNIQLKLKQKINIKGKHIRGCSLPPEGKMVLSCWYDGTIRFINKEGVISSQIGEDKTGSRVYDAVYIKDSNSVLMLSFFSPFSPAQ
jgi:hypothetical protein